MKKGRKIISFLLAFVISCVGVISYITPGHVEAEAKKSYLYFDSKIIELAEGQTVNTVEDLNLSGPSAFQNAQVIFREEGDFSSSITSSEMEAYLKDDMVGMDRLCPLNTEEGYNGEKTVKMALYNGETGLYALYRTYELTLTYQNGTMTDAKITLLTEVTNNSVDFEFKTYLQDNCCYIYEDTLMKKVQETAVDTIETTNNIFRYRVVDTNGNPLPNYIIRTKNAMPGTDYPVKSYNSIRLQTDENGYGQLYYEDDKNYAKDIHLTHPNVSMVTQSNNYQRFYAEDGLVSTRNLTDTFSNFSYLYGKYMYVNASSMEASYKKLTGLETGYETIWSNCDLLKSYSKVLQENGNTEQTIRLSDLEAAYDTTYDVADYSYAVIYPLVKDTRDYFKGCTTTLKNKSSFTIKELDIALKEFYGEFYKNGTVDLYGFWEKMFYKALSAKREDFSDSNIIESATDFNSLYEDWLDYGVLIFTRPAVSKNASGYPFCKYENGVYNTYTNENAYKRLTFDLYRAYNGISVSEEEQAEAEAIISTSRYYNYLLEEKSVTDYLYKSLEGSDDRYVKNKEYPYDYQDIFSTSVMGTLLKANTSLNAYANKLTTTGTAFANQLPYEAYDNSNLHLGRYFTAYTSAMFLGVYDCNGKGTFTAQSPVQAENVVLDFSLACELDGSEQTINRYSLLTKYNKSRLEYLSKSGGTLTTYAIEPAVNEIAAKCTITQEKSIVDVTSDTFSCLDCNYYTITITVDESVLANYINTRTLAAEECYEEKSGALTTGDIYRLKVVDGTSKKPVENCLVKINGETVKTDSDGYVELGISSIDYTASKYYYNDGVNKVVNTRTVVGAYPENERVSADGKDTGIYHLGKYLWIVDHIQNNRYEIGVGGTTVTLGLPDTALSAGTPVKSIKTRVTPVLDVAETKDESVKFVLDRGVTDASTGKKVYTATLTTSDYEIYKAPAPDSVLGDVDGNGTITAEDALAVLKHVVGVQSVSEEKYADVDKNGSITAEDALCILKYVVGILESFEKDVMELD